MNDRYDGLVFSEPAPNISIKPKKWHCPKGHKWESFGAFAVWVEEETFLLCPYCMAEQFPAEEVKEEI